MSAESKESQPSIDDILSSIREIITDESAEKGGSGGDGPQASDTTTASYQNGGGDGRSDILGVLRGGQAQEPDEMPASDDAPAPAEDVMDLSEEFIVTEATAALRRERERLAQAEADTPVAQGEPPETDAPEPAPGDPEPAPQGDDGIGDSGLWAQDFQMPVGDDGPTSPFTAAQNHPESAWPATDPFDVTESYKLARSIGANARFSPADDADAPETADAEEPAPQDAPEDPVPAEDESGIELTSLSESGAEDADAAETASEAQFDADPAAEHPQPEQEPLRAFPAADELEAVFGMPPRGWSGPSEPQAQAHAADDEAAAGETDDHAEDALTAHEPDEWPAAAMADDADSVSYADASNAEPEAEPAPAQPAAEPDRGHETRQAAYPQEQEPAYPREQEMAVQPSPAAENPVSSAAMGGKTLEDSVKELLRPMLQEWLDKNMPRLVEAAMREQVGASQAQASEQGAPAQGPSDQWRDDER